MNTDWHAMARLSELDWLFTWFFLLLLVAMPFAAILRADNRQTLGQSRYFLRMSALILVGYGVTALVTIDPFHIAGQTYFLVNLDAVITDFDLFSLWKVCVLISYYLQTRWTVCRIRHIGRFSIWWALLMLLPTVSLIPTLVFALIPPRDLQPPELQSDDSGDEKSVQLLRAS